MSNHKMVNGKLLQMNKPYSQLKQKQKEKIGNWMYEEFQSEIQKLEAYYTSRKWKDDFSVDEAGEYPEKLKSGVLSEDGIWNMLGRNKELMERIKRTGSNYSNGLFWSGIIFCG